MKMANVMRGLAVATLFASLWPIACGSDSGSNSGSTGNQNGTGGGKNKGDSGAPMTTPTSTASSPVPAGSVACGTHARDARRPHGRALLCGQVHGHLRIHLSHWRYLHAGAAACASGVPDAAEHRVHRARRVCTAKGECGIDESMLQMGCINYADAKALGAMFMMGGMGFNVTLPDEAPCTPPDGGVALAARYFPRCSSR